MASSWSLVLEPGALVLVTGVNGLIGSHVADQLLARGYGVRGVVREVAKSQWLAEFFKERRKGASFELVAVPDMTEDGCYDEAIKGAHGLIHIASPLSGQTPEEIIPIAVKGALNALKAAARESTVERVVLTSSSVAATMPKPNVEFSIDQETFNEQVVRDVSKFAEMGEDGSYPAMYLYGASKTQAEKEAWKWVRENKPQFVFNTILPNANFGQVLVPEKQGYPSTIDWAKRAFDSDMIELLAKAIAPQWFVDTVDCALLHIAALIYSDVKSERIFAFAERFNWNEIVSIYKRLHPDRTFVTDLPDYGRDLCTVPNEHALELLKRLGRDGWTTLEESLRAMTNQFVEAEDKGS